jgi:hypothetical protein
VRKAPSWLAKGGSFGASKDKESAVPAASPAASAAPTPSNLLSAPPSGVQRAVSAGSSFGGGRGDDVEIERDYGGLDNGVTTSAGALGGDAKSGGGAFGARFPYRDRGAAGGGGVERGDHRGVFGGTRRQYVPAAERGPQGAGGPAGTGGEREFRDFRSGGTSATAADRPSGATTGLFRSTSGGADREREGGESTRRFGGGDRGERAAFGAAVDGAGSSGPTPSGSAGPASAAASPAAAAFPAGPDARGVLRVSKAALLALYSPSLMPPYLEHGLTEGLATRDSLGPVSWGAVNWGDLWAR